MNNLTRIREIATSKIRLTDDHEYILPDGTVMQRSVTRVVDKQFKPFDKERIAGFVARNYDKSVDEVLEEWEAIRDHGSEVHQQIHDELSGLSVATYPRAKRGIKFTRTKFDGWELFSEVKVWDEEWSIGGSIDLLAVNAQDEVTIIDWKCNRLAPTNEQDGYGITPAFESIPNSKIAKYSAQISLYRVLLERMNVETEVAHIVYLSESKAQVIPVDDYREQVVIAVKETIVSPNY